MPGASLPLFLPVLVVVLSAPCCIPFPYALLALALVNSPSMILPPVLSLCSLHVLRLRLLPLAADTVLRGIPSS